MDRMNDFNLGKWIIAIVVIWVDTILVEMF